MAFNGVKGQLFSLEHCFIGKEINVKSYVYIFLTHGIIKITTGFDVVMSDLLICCLQYISLYSIVPGVLRSCNIILTYNQSTERLQFINSTWDAMPVSHLHAYVVVYITGKL